MPKQSRLTQFNEYKEIYQKKAHGLVLEKLGKIPEVLYCTGWAGENYDPQEWAVMHVTGPWVQGTYFDKRPSAECVERMKEACKSDIDMDGVTLHVQRGGSSTGVHIADLGKKWFESRNEAEAEAQVLRAKFIARDGQFNCRYCRVATDNSKKVRGTIVSRMYAPSYQKEFDYCSEECASCDQMAHEG